jgi:thiol-disulfide isomerase/thioredoxin
MKSWQRAVVSAGLIAFAFLATAQAVGQARGDKITVKAITYPELGKHIRGLRGKVIVVDFWNTTCVPCRKEFPNLVRMSNKLAKDGFVGISVSTNNSKDAKQVKAVEKFLTDQKTPTTNFILDATKEELEKKLKLSSVPCVIVFDRENRIAKRLPVLDKKGESIEDVDYKAIEKLVVDLLKAK